MVAVQCWPRTTAVTSPARKRFLREARSSAGVRHDNVVRVYAVGEQPLPFLVMEFVAGEALQQRLDRAGPLGPREVADRRQVAEGWRPPARTRLIHQDIKPANILIEACPDRRVKLTDFGLARATDDANPDPVRG
ncbi:MAG: protein kinase [Gemmataceae bacterium]